MAAGRVPRDAEAPVRLRDQAASDLDDPLPLARHRQQQVDHQVEVSGHALPADREAGRKPGVVEQCALSVRERGPEAPQPLCRKVHAELRNIALDAGADERVAPLVAAGVVGRREALRDAVALPQPIEVFRRGTDLGRRLRAERNDYSPRVRDGCCVSTPRWCADRRY